MKLGNIINYRKGKAPTGIKLSDDLVIYLSPEYLRNKAKETLMPNFSGKVEVKDGDLLLLWDGSNAGEFFMARNGVLSSTMVKLFFDESVNDRLFLYYQLKFFEDFLKSQTNGSGIPHVDKEILLSIDVKYFKPSEQTQIATILSKVDEAIAQTEQLIAKYTRIKTGLMQDLLTKGIDENGIIRSEETHEFMDSALGKIPKDWKVKSLKEITCHDITYGIVQAGPHVENGVPYIRTGDMSRDQLQIDKLLRTTQIIASRFTRSKVRKGEIVFALRATIGKVLLVPIELDGANLTQGTARIAANEEKILNSFLLWCLRMQYFSLQILQNQKGTTFFEISLTQLRKMEVYFPIDLKEQKKIVEVMEDVEKNISATREEYDKLQSLKIGLMQDLLSGRIRVNNLIKQTVGL